MANQRDYTRGLDKGIANVMPSDWDGHGRLKIHEYELSDKQYKMATELFENLSEKYDTPPTKLAKICVEKVRERTA